ncbi:error-prone DNA polymerase [Amnibacterium kyonggiense]|uniref:error-prone DNA polymerase n=1 Tax=Amnibacterium kyonggiense TaxID=595671 RepID=UPI00105CDC35|nr:error-prone DNA polymerase [Amnibacterium kyonggiense]
MGYSNPPIPWSEFERRLSDARRPGGPEADGDGGDSPAWSHKRHPYRPPVPAPPKEPDPDAVPYAELHAHSNFSFLDGASGPEELLEEAASLGLHALAITDHDGFYGSVRMAEAADQHPVHTVFGAELSLGLGAPQQGVPDPEGSHLLLLARGSDGYHAISGLITEAQLAAQAEKGRPEYDEAQIAERLAGRVIALTGCRKGRVRQALLTPTGLDEAAAARELDRLVDVFGRDGTVVELFDTGDPLDGPANDALHALAQHRRLRVVATSNAHAASPDRRRLATALAAVRARRSLDEMDGWLPASVSHLRSGAEQRDRFARWPGAVETTVEIADETRFVLRSLKPGLPKLQVPEGHTPMTWLRRLVHDAIPVKYPKATAAHLARIERELAVIEEKDFPGYFLIVHGIVSYAKSQGILCQGRGSAANSAVCYLLGITAIDSIFFDLPFERFLSALRDEEPDIDVDFDSDRREEVIQHVYRLYGRRNAAQVANVITYRPKNAVRDMAKALGASTGQQDAWSRQVERWGAVTESTDHDIPGPVVDLAEQLLKAPRHLGIHSGGMVLTDRPVGEVVPIEHARMEDRTVLQWDKDDCAYMGLVKFDLLGLGMLAALQYAFDLAAEHTGERWTLETIPKEEQGVYDQLCRADAIGVFQVESRAQLGLLPRFLPRRFYDLAIEVALIRPGPIQGGAVHPIVRRRRGDEPVSYLHPLLEPVLSRTLGVPIFQEQLMQIAMAVGGCSGEDADLLRRAMGSKRGIEKIESLKGKLYAGMTGNGITGAVADEIYTKIQAFASFGFAESHSLSFALLVYASSWMRLHYPGVFLASLLRAQPMGFYSPASLTADARRHGVVVRRPDINRSGVDAGMEPIRGTTPGGMRSCLDPEQPPVEPDFDHVAPARDAEHRRDGALAVRLGLAGITGIGAKLAQRIVAERTAHGEYRDQRDLARRVGLSAQQLEALATAGVFEGFGMTVREALWAAGAAAEERPDTLPHTSIVVQPPLLPETSGMDRVAADLWATGISVDDHPVAHVRAELAERGVLSSAALHRAESGRRVEIGGVVTHRQRPATASGITFLNLEDETGMVNVIASVGVWQRYRRVAREAPAMIVRGILERSAEGVVNVVADRFERLPIGAKHVSRDFR